MAFTWFESGGVFPIGSIVSRSQSRTVRMEVIAAKENSAGLNSKEVTKVGLGFFNAWTSFPATRSHNRICPSFDDDATHFPSGLNRTQVI